MSWGRRSDITTHDCLECCGRGFYHSTKSDLKNLRLKIDRIMCRNCDGVGLIFISDSPPVKPKGK